MPYTIARVLSGRMATLAELDSVLGAEDMYTLQEVMAVDAYNSMRED